jgi:hypothetical protein
MLSKLVKYFMFMFFGRWEILLCAGFTALSYSTVLKAYFSKMELTSKKTKFLLPRLFFVVFSFGNFPALFVD